MSFKEWWKRRAYWQRGGLVGMLIPTFFFLIIMILGGIRFIGIEVPYFFEVIGSSIVIIFIVTNFWVSFLFLQCFGDKCIRPMFYMAYISSLLEFFIIGALMGKRIFRKNKK